MNLLHTLKRIFSDKGLLLTLGLSLSIVCIFYGKLLLHPCSTYFGAHGDGLQIYYETLFHTKFDTEYWRQNSINYPYGESIFFTGAMPFLNNLVKIFGPSAAPLGVGLINLMMLFSPVIGAVFIYAIFRHLRLPWHYGALTATAIAFLSPQMMRMQGHYSLQWVFLIPALFYLLLRFYDYPSLWKSFAIAGLIFLGASTHLYFLAFFAAIAGPYWAILFITRDRGFGRITFVLKHASIQFLLPVIILQSLVMMSDHVPDRTTAPWGYFVYHSNIAGVLFPFGRPYEDFIRSFCPPDRVEAEGIAFIGLAGIIGLVTIILIQLARLFSGRIKLLLSITENKVLNIFFWTSVLLLWISCGHPFIGGHEDWLAYFGPLRQFRSVGRFAWLFFYIINIITVYRLYRLIQQKKGVSYVVMIVITSLLFFDMYYNIRGAQDQYNNRIAALEDESNSLPENAWLKKFNPKMYQAILPLPYFHIGSENLCRVATDPEIVSCSYIVSLKTGLPMMGVTSARVSLGQTRKMVPLILDPIEEIPVLNDLPDKRPLLLVVREGLLDENERRILSLANPVGSSSEYKLFSLDPALLRTLMKMRYESVKTDYAAAEKFPAGIFTSTDSLAPYFYQSFDQQKGKAYRGKGSFEGKFQVNNTLYDSTFSVPGNYLLNFWFNHIGDDIYPRTVIEIFATDPNGKAQPYYFLSNALTQLKAIDRNWALEELPITIPAANSHLKITVWNSEMKKNDFFEIDELLIRPAAVDLYQINNDTITRNNRTYFPKR